MFRNYILRRNKIGGVGMLGGRLAPVFFYKGLSATTWLFNFVLRPFGRRESGRAGERGSEITL